ncbi:hypothetical protein [Arcobacter vandammei]|uniref:hypothetical protein n=1 Tax=Arcobacter vandammei TaxID=2782243 RepID=UPI0018DF4B49|nr:hypothetical protein [Arcobacter vandammei]
MKDLILNIGEKVLNIFVIIGIIAVVISGLSMGFSGIFVILIGIVSIIMTTFLLYLLIDIRDKSAKTNELLSKILEEKNKDL